jgi:galactokinase
MIDALKQSDLRKIGVLLNESHRSSRIYFENSTPELDFIVSALSEQSQVYGARLTGGGFGGAVMALTSNNYSQELADKIATLYSERFGSKLEIIHTITGDGAALI